MGVTTNFFIILVKKDSGDAKSTICRLIIKKSDSFVVLIQDYEDIC
jgi:hypothetical protein